MITSAGCCLKDRGDGIEPPREVADVFHQLVKPGFDPGSLLGGHRHHDSSVSGRRQPVSVISTSKLLPLTSWLTLRYARRVSGRT